MNNLRQMQMAWQLYIDDNQTLMPLNRSVDNPLPERLFGRLNSSNSWVVGSPKQDITPANLRVGTLFPYADRAVEAYHCPADHSTVVGRSDLLRNRSYSVSTYLNGDEEGIDPRVKSQDSELINPGPERVFVFIEEHADSAWLGSFIIEAQAKFALSSGAWVSTPSDRHNQGCNLSFADNHVEYWKWFWPKRANLQSMLASNGHELRDLKRLQSAVPK